MKNFKYIVFAFLLVFTLTGNAQQTPANKQTEAITIKGATAHLGNGSVIENSVIVFENGKLTAVGKSSTATKGKIIDATGKHVYPGFIMPNSTLGLVEVEAVKASDDQSEMGSMLPHIRSLIAYNAESKIVESLRPNGVLLAQVTPRGGRIAGTSSVVQFDAWNWEDAAIKADDGIHMNWPSSFRQGRWWMGEERGFKPNKNYIKQVDVLKSYFTQAKTYLNGSKSPKNLPFEATKGLFDGSQRLFVNANGAQEITDAINFAKSLGIEHVIIVGGYKVWEVLDVLKKHNVPVLAGRTHSSPDAEDDSFYLPHELPKILMDAGVLVALENSGQMERMNGRNLPFYAGSVAAQGLNKEKALQLITLNAAKILGIDKEYGSLEVGKSATLFISEGDALDMRTNKLSKAFIDGRDISLETHQTKLYKRYMGKYGKETE